MFSQATYEQCNEENYPYWKFYVISMLYNSLQFTMRFCWARKIANKAYWLTISIGNEAAVHGACCSEASSYRAGKLWVQAQGCGVEEKTLDTDGMHHQG